MPRPMAVDRVGWAAFQAPARLSVSFSNPHPLGRPGPTPNPFATPLGTTARDRVPPVDDPLLQGSHGEAYTPSICPNMVNAMGGPAAAKKLNNDPTPSDGFRRRWEMGRLDLTAEYVFAHEAKYRDLFTSAERMTSRRRYEEYKRTPARSASFAGGDGAYVSITSASPPPIPTSAGRLSPSCHHQHQATARRASGPGRRRGRRCRRSRRRPGPGTSCSGGGSA
jgi:hypothetical protein